MWRGAQRRYEESEDVARWRGGDIWGHRACGDWGSCSEQDCNTSEVLDITKYAIGEKEKRPDSQDGSTGSEQRQVAGGPKERIDWERLHEATSYVEITGKAKWKQKLPAAVFFISNKHESYPVK